MAQTFKFDEFEPGKGIHAAACLACDAMLADALDGTLSAAEQVWFDQHLSTCDECTQRMADAQRGAAWLEMLKAPRPEPPAHLMERILAQTSGAGNSSQSVDLQPVPQYAPAAAAFPGSARTNLLPFRAPFRMPLPRFSNTWFEPRLAMTAAMAFFSLALTLNLTGVKLNELHASDLKPSSLKRTYYEASAHASRIYDNLRVVRVMESRVEDLRQASDEDEQDRRRPSESTPSDAQPAPQDKFQENKPLDAKPDDKAQPKDPGVSRREAPANAPGFLLSRDSENRARRVALPASIQFSKTEGGLV